MKSYLYYPDAYSVSIVKRSGDATHLSQTATAFFLNILLASNSI